MSKINQSREEPSQGGRWKQWKEPEARAALASWRRSGLNATAFCAREGYSVKRLRYWQERLREASSPRPAAVSFVPITVGEVRQGRQLEIERSGVVVRVREDLDVAHVARLVAALRAVEPPC